MTRVSTGTTGDDRMDIANAIGVDLVPDITLALAIADRVLESKWLEETEAFFRMNL